MTRTIFKTMLTLLAGMTLAIQAFAGSEQGLRRYYEGRMTLDRDYSLAMRFLIETEGHYYYQTDLGDEPDALTEITPQSEGRYQVRVVRPTRRTVYTFFLTPAERTFSSAAVVQYQNAGDDVEDPNTGAVYWVKHSGFAQKLEESAALSLQTSLLTPERGQQALGEVRATGKMEYFKCDGCEHGDQLMITDRNTGLLVNAAYLDLMPYFEVGCEATVHRWITQLMDLGVPFTFVGPIHVLTTDLKDDGHWVGARTGKLYVGTDMKPEHELRAFFAKLPWTDGDFASYSAEAKLAFSAGGGEVTYIYDVGK